MTPEAITRSRRIALLYVLNIGLLYSVAHILIFSTTNHLNLIISLISFGLCFLCATLSLLPANTKIPKPFKLENTPLFITGVAMLLQSAISFASGFATQGIMGFGFATGNIVKAFELETEKKGEVFAANHPILRFLFRPEMLHSIGNIALAYFSSSIGLYFLPLLFVSLTMSLLTNWKGERINYAWPRLLITIYYLSLSIAALFAGNFAAAAANALFVAGSSIITIKMNRNFYKLNNIGAGLSLTKPIWQVLCLFCLLTLPACGFHPVYGGQGYNGSPVAEQLGQIAIGPIPERAGQMLRNDLIDRMYGKAGRPAQPIYHLDITLSSTEEDLGLLSNATTTLSSLHTTCTYTLKDAGGKVLFSGIARGTATFDKLISQYGTLAAHDSAVERTVREVSEQIVNRLGVYFAEPPPQTPQVTPIAPTDVPTLSSTLSRQ